ncbi:Guanine nucleotide-binding protein alpha-3 subunit, partial [Leucoagaricus sp. SymC.cos]
QQGKEQCHRQIIKEDHKRYKQECKILLLGSSKLEKSTIIKQMKIMHQQGFTQAELERFKPMIYQNALDSAQGHCLISADSAAYFFAEVVPTKMGMLRVRMKSLGITKMRFTMGTLSIHMFNVGKQRSECKRWIHYFEGLTSIIFCTALSEYDQVLFEEWNQMCFSPSFVVPDLSQLSEVLAASDTESDENKSNREKSEGNSERVNWKEKYDQSDVEMIDEDKKIEKQGSADGKESDMEIMDGYEQVRRKGGNEKNINFENEDQGKVNSALADEWTRNDGDNAPCISQIGENIANLQRKDSGLSEANEKSTKQDKGKGKKNRMDMKSVGKDESRTTQQKSSNLLDTDCKDTTQSEWKGKAKKKVRDSVETRGDENTMRQQKGSTLSQTASKDVLKSKGKGKRDGEPTKSIEKNKKATKISKITPDKVKHRALKCLQKLLQNPSADWTSEYQQLTVLAARERDSDLIVTLPTESGKMMIPAISARLYLRSVIVIIIPFIVVLDDTMHQFQGYDIFCTVFEHNMAEFPENYPIILCIIDLAVTREFRVCVLYAIAQSRMRAVLIDEVHEVPMAKKYCPVMETTYVLSSTGCQVIAMLATIPPPMEQLIINTLHLTQGLKVI